MAETEYFPKLVQLFGLPDPPKVLEGGKGAAFIFEKSKGEVKT